MPLPPRIVLHSPIVEREKLPPFIERCLRDGVCLIAVIGEEAEALEEEIDWLVVGDGNDHTRFVVTTAHTDESLEEVLEFAAGWDCERDGLLEVRF
jgi:hypothetical protein